MFSPESAAAATAEVTQSAVSTVATEGMLWSGCCTAFPRALNLELLLAEAAVAAGAASTHAQMLQILLAVPLGVVAIQVGKLSGFVSLVVA